MKYLKIVLIIVFFLAVSALLSWMLLNSPVELSIHCRTAKPVNVKIYPSLPMDRSIGKKAFTCRLEPASGGNAVSRLHVSFPLSCLRKFRFEIPPENEIEISRMEYNLWGGIHVAIPVYFLAKSSFRNLDMIHIYGQDNSQPEAVKIVTRQQTGRLDVRAVNDMPRFLSIVLAMLAAALIIWVVCLVIRAFRDGVNTEKMLLAAFLILIFAGWLIPLVYSPAFSAAGEPRLNLLTLTDYPEQFTSWYRNNLPIRSHLISLYQKFCRLMHVSPTEKVIIGQDGWLFLHYSNSKKKDNSYESYFGNRLFTPGELHRILGNLKSVQSLLKKKNIRFAVFISPGKPSVYGDKLPPAWRRKDPDGPTRALQLYDHIRKNSDIPVEFPRKELIAARKSCKQPLYFKTDTHWNSLGGYIGACSMMKLIDPEAARKMPDLASYELTLVPRTANDLRRMLNLPPQDEHDAWQIRHPDFQYERYLTVNDSGSYSFAGQDPNGKRVLFIRDSFLCGWLRIWPVT
ncbi:MAG: hypothetical protein J5858_14750 [Lentisphaeria bacterium]|nr:hypothetical protein [Lentisphaeria bacterium]